MGNYKVLKTPETDVMQYSMYDLIEAVRGNELIWRRENPNFHNRELRQLAWNQVARMVYHGFDACSPREQENIKATLLRRWKNARDSLLRSQRNKEDVKNGLKARYIYEKELSFILTTRPETKAQPTESTTSMTLRNLRKRPSYNIPEPHIPLQLKKEDSSSSSEILEPEQNWLEGEATNFEMITCPPPVPEVVNKSTFNNNNGGGDDSGGSKSKKSKQTEKGNVKTTSFNTENVSFQIIGLEPGPSMSSATQLEHNPISNNIQSNSQINGMNISHSQSLSQSHNHTHFDPNSSIATQTEEAVSFMTDRETDPDQDFLNSLKPYMKRMNFDRKLDFKIHMLKLIKNYK